MRPLLIVSLLVALHAVTSIVPQRASGQQVSVSFQLFYDELSPYGTWVEYPGYGYAWIPAGDPGFSPYATEGRWAYTDDGWTWVSDYPWGWAAFHYGRWDYDTQYGWLWIPDDEWAPAWVTWRRSPGYFGWAPLRPGTSVALALGRDYRERNERWIFVRDTDMARPDVSRHLIDRADNSAILMNSRVIATTQKDARRNATFIAGPGRDDVQKRTQAPVTQVFIRDSDSPGHHLTDSELQIFRPQIHKKEGTGKSPAPSNVTKRIDVRSLEARNAVHLTNDREKNQKRETPSSRRLNAGQEKDQRKRVD